MDIFAVLNVAVGLIFLYSILSLMASQIQELISTFLGWRAKHLKEAIANIFGENSEGKLTQKFFEHPLIQSLKQTTSKNSNKTRINYIHSKKFSNVFIEIIKDLADSNGKSIDPLSEDIKNLAMPEKFKTKLINAAKEVKSEAQETNTKIEELQQEIEEWFNSEMEMVSVIYKQNAKRIAIAVAITLVVVLNVDTVHIVNSLFKAQTLSSTIDPIAEQLVASHSQDFLCLQTPENQVDKASCFTNMKSDIDNIFFNNVFELPIGWNLSEPFNKQFNPLKLQNVVKVITGWLLSALAISLGAPFWFDMLRQVINISESEKKITTVD